MRLDELNDICRRAGISGGARDTLNAGLSVLHSAGIQVLLSLPLETLQPYQSAGFDVVSPQPDMGDLAFVTMPEVSGEELERLRKSWRNAPLTILPIIPMESAGTYARAHHLRALLPDAEAPDAAWLDRHGHDEALDCPCPLHTAARARAL